MKCFTKPSKGCKMPSTKWSTNEMHFIRVFRFSALNLTRITWYRIKALVDDDSARRQGGDA